MDLNLTANELAFRDELRAWIKSNAPAHARTLPKDDEGKRQHYTYLRKWQAKLFEGGWAGISWPKQFGGRGASLIEQAIYYEEMALANAPERLGVIGEGLVGPTIIAVGADAQKQRYLPAILSGKEIWCQGFSEPNAGSDLASLSTKAVREGDTFIVNGQKIWTSFANIADQCLLVVRTDATAAKHKGLTSLLVDMKSPGITVRPLKMMSGDASFNEMFFSDVRVPVANVLGSINEGWKVAITALGNERSNLGIGSYVQFKRNLDALIVRASKTERNGQPLTANPLVRQKLAQAFLELEIFRLNTLRTLTSASRSGSAGPEGSILKLFWSEMNQRTAQIALEIFGIEGQLWKLDDGRWNYNYLRSRGNTIEAGTSEIQRNIIAQRVLGLPRSY